MKLLLKLFTPWIAVGIFWCIFKNAWLAILVYHLQIILWSRRPFSGLFKEGWRKALLFASPAILAGPIAYFLLPVITKTDIALWLAEHHLTGTGFLLMIPYFGIIHPILEQIHWTPLRERTWLAHPLFAGYHMLVLASLLPAQWLIFCFIVLTATSVFWRWSTKQHGAIIPVCSHMLADSGIIAAAWFNM